MWIVTDIGVVFNSNEVTRIYKDCNTTLVVEYKNGKSTSYTPGNKNQLDYMFDKVCELLSAKKAF